MRGIRFIRLLFICWTIFASCVTLSIWIKIPDGGRKKHSIPVNPPPTVAPEDDIYVLNTSAYLASLQQQQQVSTDAPITASPKTPSPPPPTVTVFVTGPPLQQQTSTPPNRVIDVTSPPQSPSPITTHIPVIETQQPPPPPSTTSIPSSPHHHHHHHYEKYLKTQSSDNVDVLIARTLAPYRKKWYGTSEQSLTVNHTIYTATGCDMFTIPFDPVNDEKCLAFITNQDNWDHIKPMNQEYDERTAKFKVKFKNLPDMRAIIKMPQKLFPTEPFGEIGAYHFDRVFGVNRVPPTGLICLPRDLLVNLTKRTKMDLVDEFAQESHVSNYSDWIQKDIYDFLPHEKECIHASIQLFMAGVIRFLDSIYTFPYKPHNASWHRFYTPEIGFPNAKVELGRNLMRIGLLHMSSLVLMDYIGGNIDRSPNKNNFVAGGCYHPHKTNNCDLPEDALEHLGFPSFLHLDQGMFFVTTPRRSPLHLDNSTFCAFPATLHAKVQDIAKMGRNHVMEELKRRIPKFAYDQLDEYSLRNTEPRMRRALRHIKKCVDLYGIEKVLLT